MNSDRHPAKAGMKKKWVQYEAAKRYIRRFKDRLNADRSKAWHPHPDYELGVMQMTVGYSQKTRKVRIIPKKTS